MESRSEACTDTERWVYKTCERIVLAGQERLYRDLYKDLRERLPCCVACLLIAEGLRRTRHVGRSGEPYPLPRVSVHRANAIAALARLARYDEWARSS